MAGVFHGALGIIGLIAGILVIIRLLIGDEGEQRAKDKLTDWYVLVGDANFLILIQSAALNTEKLLERTLGERHWSGKAFVRWFAVAATLGVPIGVVLMRTFFDLASSGNALAEAVVSLLVVVALSPFDFAFLVFSRQLFERIEKEQGIKAGLVYLAAVYGAFTLTTSITVYAIVMFGAVSNGHPFPRFSPEALFYFLVRGLEWPYVIWFYPPTLLFIIPFMLSTLLFGIVILGALLMRQFRWILQPFAVWLIYRLGASKMGPFASAAGAALALSAFLNALIAFMKW